MHPVAGRRHPCTAGNLPLVLVLSLIKSPNLPFNTAAQAELAVSYIMLGWWYATLVQMPLGEL